MLTSIIAAIVLFASGGGSTTAKASFNRQMIDSIRIAIENGYYDGVQGQLDTLAQLEPENPEVYHLLGRIAELKEDVKQAVAHYEEESTLRKDADVGLLKKVASMNGWLRNYKEARTWWRKALVQRPDDREAARNLKRLSLRRSLHFFSSAGGWEPDYTTNNYKIGSFLGWYDWLDFYVSYSKMDKLFYRRVNLSFDAYMFPSFRTYVRLGGRYKRYIYPLEINPNPDHNAYEDIPDVQIEVGHYYSSANNYSVELEYFRPNFYWSKDLKANNLKLSASVRNWLFRPFYGKLYLAFLHDPKSSSFLIEPKIRKILDFKYQNQFLLGGAMGFDAANMNVELKYLPNRDMDGSTDYSIFLKAKYVRRGLGVQYDFLYDSYVQSLVRRPSSQVHVFSFIVERWAFLKLRVGAKALHRDGTQINPFILFRIKTGF